MKKNIDIDKLLSEKAVIMIPEHIEAKCQETIRRISMEKKQPKIIPFYKPVMAFGLISAAIITIIITFYPKLSSRQESYITLEKDVPATQDNSSNQMLNREDLVPDQSKFYDNEIQDPKIKITSRGIILTWENPLDENFKEVRIEQITKTEQVLVYTGKGQIFIDNDYDSGKMESYRISVVDKNDLFSKGVIIEIPQD